MDKLPFEVLLHIFEYLPFSSYEPLYSVFPQELLDESVVYKLRNNKTKPVIDLISTNLHELSATVLNQRNESSLSLYFASFDSSRRFIWTLPDFNHSHHYFRVKDAYVSHGKLVLRKPHDDDVMPNYYYQKRYQQKSLSSLWDIRKSFPPTRAGSFSGASEYSRIKSQELTIHQSGCILDSCLLPSGVTNSNSNSNNNTVVKVVATRAGEVAAVGTATTSDAKEKEEDDRPKRPKLPVNYRRQVPINNTSSWTPSTYPDPTCGYFLVERLAISIPTFLELYSPL